MACKAKEHGKVKRRGGPSIEWYKNGKPKYYCSGYVDLKTDDWLPECKACRSHVSKAQLDLDEWRKQHG